MEFNLHSQIMQPPWLIQTTLLYQNCQNHSETVCNKIREIQSKCATSVMQSADMKNSFFSLWSATMWLIRLWSRCILLLLLSLLLPHLFSAGLQGSGDSPAQNEKLHIRLQPWVIWDGITLVHLKDEVLWDNTLICPLCPHSGVINCPWIRPWRMQEHQQRSYSNKIRWHYFHATQFCGHRSSCTCHLTKSEPLLFSLQL